jgi:putative methyltransferase
VIKDVLDIANVLNSKWKRQEPLVFIVCYDILFGKVGGRQLRLVLL